MSKKLQGALIELLLFMVGMIVHQSNIFGLDDIGKLNDKMKRVVIIALQED